MWTHMKNVLVPTASSPTRAFSLQARKGGSATSSALGAESTALLAGSWEGNW